MTTLSAKDRALLRLADRMLIRTPEVRRKCDRLVVRGFLEFRWAEGEARCYRVTPEGRAALDTDHD